MQIFKLCTSLLCLVLLIGCSPTRRLAAGEQLFEGAAIQFSKPNALVNKKLLEEELLALVRPQPNSAFKLGIYNLVKEPKKQKGFAHWLKYKVGEPPVLFDFASADRSRLVFEKYLQENGYLNAWVKLDTINQPKKVKTIYEINAQKRYRINTIFLPDSTSVLDEISKKNQQQSFLKEGQVYKAENLRSERFRLANLATQNGYFGLNQNDIYFYVDTSRYVDSIDLYLRWKPAKDSSGFKQYRLGDTFIYPTYSLTASSKTKQDTIIHQGLTIIEDHYFIKEKLLRNAIRGTRGDLYDGQLQTSTIRYLQDLDVFKFINLRTTTREEDGEYFIDRKFYLTPTQVRNLRFDFEANTRSGSYFGILAAANYSHKNWLGGAERLDLNVSVGGETQVGDTNRFINTLEVTAGVSVSIPRLLLPSKPKNIYQEYVPRTTFNLANAYQIRAGFFSINRLSADMAYDWRSSSKVRHLWTPLSISQNQTFNIDPDFQEELDKNSRLKNSLENVLILGGQYRFTYSSQEISKIQPYLFFSGTLELAGNIPYGIASLLNADQGPYRLLGSPFSQFLKIYADARYYLQRRTRTWAFRVAGGLIAPYGNADIAPYSEQFFIGGSTSLRAFRLRQLGPGSYINPTVSELNFFDQTGDIKLEFNAEYRFDIASYIKGAAFVDAGNIWLLNETIGDQEEGQFEFDSFFKEIAVGSGLGLRIDFQYFVIRLDAAFPLRKPIVEKGFQWTINDLDFLDKNWRRDNLVWHLAIGYPF